MSNAEVFETMLDRSRAAIRLTLSAGDPTHKTAAGGVHSVMSARVCSVPLAGQALRFGDLIWGHLARNFVAILGRRLSLLIVDSSHRDGLPHMCLYKVLRHTCTRVVHARELAFPCSASA